MPANVARAMDALQESKLLDLKDYSNSYKIDINSAGIMFEEYVKDLLTGRLYEERIDIAFPSKRLAIFVDGCFWHSCPLHGHAPKSNKSYWEAKLDSNLKRASLKDGRLRELGWEVLHFWEHEIRVNATLCAIKIKSTLNSL